MPLAKTLAAHPHPFPRWEFTAAYVILFYTMLVTRRTAGAVKQKTKFRKNATGTGLTHAMGSVKRRTILECPSTIPCGMMSCTKPPSHIIYTAGYTTTTRKRIHTYSALYVISRTSTKYARVALCVITHTYSNGRSTARGARVFGFGAQSSVPHYCRRLFAWWSSQ